MAGGIIMIGRAIGSLFGLAIAISTMYVFEVRDGLVCFLLGFGFGGFGSIIGGKL